MNLSVWNPFQEMESLLDRYGRSSGRNLATNDTDLSLTNWSPSVDIVEDKKNFNIKAEMPGVNKEDVDVELNNGVLTIHGEKKSEKKEDDNDKNYHRSECFYGSFTRRFTLPDGLKTDKIDASYNDGVLNLSIPKSKDYNKSETTKIKID